MRAVRFEGPKTGVVVAPRAANPEPAPGEALIRPRRVAVSPTDLAIAKGLLGATPITLGHEFVGVVDRVHAVPTMPRAEEAAKLVGKRVVGSINIICGQCDMCRRGLSNHCRSRSILGVHGRDGCFADAFTLPIANLSLVPDQLDDDHAVFAEPLASAMHAAQQVRLEGRTYITVLGDGPIAMLCAQVMSRLNASVRLLGTSESHLDLCERWGVKNRLVTDAGRRNDQDVVVVCSGTHDAFRLAMDLVRPRGIILLKSAATPSNTPTAPLDLSPIVTNEIEVIGSRCGRMTDAMHAMARNHVDVISLITRRYKLDDAIEALETAGRPDQIKVLMDI